jgi:hypothetical protein
VTAAGTVPGFLQLQGAEYTELGRALRDWGGASPSSPQHDLCELWHNNGAAAEAQAV